MAFKMKGDKDPMKKNFGSALNVKMNMVKGPDGKMVPDFAVDGKGANDLGPKQMRKDNAPMMRMDPSAMKAMGKPAPVKKLTEIPPKPKKQPIQTNVGAKATLSKDGKVIETKDLKFKETSLDKVFKDNKKKTKNPGRNLMIGKI